jgi:hypothetical protein
LVSARVLWRGLFSEHRSPAASKPCCADIGGEETTLSKSPTPPRTFRVADAHALADRLERNQRPQSDQAIAVKLIRALVAGRAAGDVIALQGE